jgi:Protein of unknown function (DUF2934)
MAKRRTREASAPSTPGTASELPMPPEPGDSADRAQESEVPVTEAMASEPTEEDIRLRAYHRFLHRGAEHGRHVDDWVEAEQELKQKKSND